MKYYTIIIILIFPVLSLAQKVTVDPTITPSLFKYNDQVTITYDVTGTALANLSAAYAWVWIPGNTTINAQYNINPPTAAADPAKFTKTLSNGKTLFTLSFKPSDFFTSSISSSSQMGILLKGADWSNGQTSDYIVNFWDGSFQVKLLSPTKQPLFVSNGDIISIKATTPVAADYTLYVNDVLTDTQTGIINYSYDLSTTNASSEVKLTASANSTPSTVSFDYLLHNQSPVLQRPAGIIDGINYSNDNTKATLSLWAPNKTSVYVMGDFTDWKADPAYLMNKDGEHFWLEVGGLAPGTEYAYQYLVDETIFVADPYADKVLSTDDQSIPTTTYPDLKQYPGGALHSQSYFNWLAVLQTNQTPYAWKATNYQKPAKEKLVIYELLIRDFFDSKNRNYQNLIDTIGYFKRLGVNAIELMPIMEFSGNDSWGYNPDFMFAPDKYYGTKDKLKEFIDTCHKNGIAVITDVVMNQQDMFNPYVLMYYDFVKNQPAANNPWFNQSAPHPYSVFYDMNHASAYTKKYLDTVNYHWIHDYHVDGIRFDLAKGFTQKYSGTDVNGWSAYDISRIAILKRMADAIWAYAPDTYVILEHFADNTEETELANYRVAEGKGLMLWENFNYAFTQNTMGFSNGSDFSTAYYANKGWSTPREVSYMESHDEERLMYKNLNSGNSSGGYSVKNLNTALNRMKAASVLFYTIPGAKMLWQFGELGYDQSINECTDGTTISADCRTYAKPVLWTYYNDPSRKALFNHTADMIRLRKSYSVFTQGSAVITSGNSLVKQITLNNNPYTATPKDSTQMNVQVVVNMDVTAQSASVNFAHTGTWYDYYGNGKTINVNTASYGVTLAPGEYKLYTDVPIKSAVSETVTAVDEMLASATTLYPNPTTGKFFIPETNSPQVTITTLQGVSYTVNQSDGNAYDVSWLSPGIYIVEVNAGHFKKRIKLCKI